MSVRPAVRATLILPSYNRRAITLRCLRHLRAIGVEAWADIIVVDDGSTDGTSEAVRAAFPGVVVVLGNGQLFWTGAIVLGMRHAMTNGTGCCVWLNDDSHPVAGAVERLAEYAVAQDCIAAGLSHFVGTDPPVTLLPFRKTHWGLRLVTARPDTRERMDVDASRGNLVAIPRHIVETIGYPDEAGLPQYFADLDYLLRAGRAGFRCVVDPVAAVEEMEYSGNWDASWLTTDRPLRWIWARFTMVQASLYWRANWVFYRRHWGLGRGGLLFAAPYIRLALISLVRLLVPGRWIRRLRQGKRH